MLNVFKDETEARPKNMSKTVRTLHLMYSEDGIKDRLGKVRGCIHLHEMLHTVSAKPIQWVTKSRKYYSALSKTSAGDALGALRLQSWADSWAVPAADKRKIHVLLHFSVGFRE